MRNRFFYVVTLSLSFSSFAQCDNPHCRYEWLGYNQGETLSEEDFLTNSVWSSVFDMYLPKLSIMFRKLNWQLYSIEKAISDGDFCAASNSVQEIQNILSGGQMPHSDNNTSSTIETPASMRLYMIEKIELCLARLVLGKGRDFTYEQIDRLVPDEYLKILDKRMAKSEMTFKHMLALACLIESYSKENSCYPLNLNEILAPERFLKCAMNKDIEYEYFAGKWILRCRCESYSGGLSFDEYIPAVFNNRKRMDLCFSPSFNKKRALLFEGVNLNEKDIRISGTVKHESNMCGVHPIDFKDRLAGCMRLLPKDAESRNWDNVQDREEDD